jgi:hypothetical protein
MNVIAAAFLANTFAGNIRAYIFAASPAIICRTYGS